MNFKNTSLNLKKKLPLFITFAICIIAGIGSLLIAVGVFGKHAGWIATDGLIVDTKPASGISLVDYTTNDGVFVQKAELNSYSISYIIGQTKVPILYNPSNLTQIASNSGMTKALPWICFGIFTGVGVCGTVYTIIKEHIGKKDLSNQGGNSDE